MKKWKKLFSHYTISAFVHPYLNLHHKEIKTLEECNLYIRKIVKEATKRNLSSFYRNPKIFIINKYDYKMKIIKPNGEYFFIFSEHLHKYNNKSYGKLIKTKNKILKLYIDKSILVRDILHRIPPSNESFLVIQDQETILLTRLGWRELHRLIEKHEPDTIGFMPTKCNHKTITYYDSKTITKYLEATCNKEQ